MLNKLEVSKILDDLKIVARLEKIVRDEEDINKRKYASLIVEDMLNHLYEDIKDVTEP